MQTELILILVGAVVFGLIVYSLYLEQEDAQLAAKITAMKHDLDNVEDEMNYHEVLFQEELEASQQQPKLRLIVGGK